MSVFNIKNRCNDLDMTLTELYEEVKNSDQKYKDLSFAMFSNMHRGNYTYGMGPEVMSKANEILCEKEAEHNAKRKRALS